MRRRRRQKHERLEARLGLDRDSNPPALRRASYRHSNESYGKLVRRVLWFQLSLAADGLRDLLMSPASIIAALLGLLNPRNPSWAFDHLMALGRVSDRWINLFEQEDLLPDEERGLTLDDLLDDVEREVKHRFHADEDPSSAQWTGDMSGFAGSRRRAP